FNAQKELLSAMKKGVGKTLKADGALQKRGSPSFGVRSLVSLCAMVLVAACADSEPSRGGAAAAAPDTTGFPSDPVARYGFALRRALSAVDPRGEINDYFRAFPRAEVAARSQQLAVQSVRYLTDANLAAHYALLVSILTQADTSICAEVERRTLSGPAYASLVGSLPAKKLMQWADIMVTGLLQAVRTPSAVTDVSPQEIQEAMSTLQEHLPKKDQPRFQAARNDTRRLSDAEACWFEVATYNAAAAISHQDGPRIRAALAAAEAASPLGSAGIR
ncbi:MAG TPA: hypothetical protein VHE82_00115, partial [Gemmatimonadaceae bacterium]|nr:hypothetical protein [Gemmatimonadaceae bacterium]